MESERNGGDPKERPGESGGGIFEMPEIRFTKLFISGRFVDAVSGACICILLLPPVLPFNLFFPCSCRAVSSQEWLK